jgi:hypothetical protein
MPNPNSQSLEATPAALARLPQGKSVPTGQHQLRIAPRLSPSFPPRRNWRTSGKCPYGRWS